MAAIIIGDAIEVLRTLPDEFVDAIITDPPYELGFMGKSWDGTGIAHTPEVWRECYRVLKPGGHLLSFGGSRTYHRMASAVEDAGFEIRDMVQWLYGQGFPKSMNVGKAIDKAAGREREVVGVSPNWRESKRDYAKEEWEVRGENAGKLMGPPVTPEAAEWEGWGTALKPAQEPIVLARKPFKGTVANNVLEHGTGALNIDGTRIGTTENLSGGAYAQDGSDRYDGYDNWRFKRKGDAGEYQQPEGRWPANVILTHHPECELVGTKTVGSGETKVTEFSQPNIRGNAYNSTESKQKSMGVQYGAEEVEAWECHPDCPVNILDGQTGGGFGTENRGESKGIYGTFSGESKGKVVGYGDKGGASRFFYTAKASKSERNAGLDTKNNHPTVKPIALMRYLCRLVTPPGGLVLDPFVGSGTTGIAALLEGFEFLGVEKEPEYVAIANARIDHHKGLTSAATS